MLLLEKIEQLEDLLEDKNNTINNLVNELVQCNDKNRILEEKNKTYKENIIKLEKKIKELENLFEEKNKSFNDLINKIVELDEKNKKLLKNNIENEEVTQLIMKLEVKEESITELYKKLFEKDKLIEQLNLKLLSCPFELLPEEKIISIILISFDESINYSMICKNTDNFSIIENKLYEKFPEYKNFEIYFMLKGKVINKTKNLDENMIHNNDIITIYNK